MKRIVSLWLPSFATDRLIRGQARGQVLEAAVRGPLATLVASHGGTRIAAVNAMAADAGVLPGLPLAEARALLPELTLAEADPDGDARALERLADWCGRYTPWTAIDRTSRGGGALGGGAGVWLNVSGCAHLFGGERDLLEDLLARLARSGFTAVAAIADTPGAAWAVARFAADDDPARLVAPGDTAAALAPLPVAGLRLPPEVVRDLHHLGLRSIGALRATPRAPLAARFGNGVLKRLDQALGVADEPLAPRRPLPALIVRLAFAEPLGDIEDIARAICHLIEDLCARLEGARRGARRLELTLYRTDGTVSRAAIGTSRPTRDPVHLRRLFRETLSQLDAGFGVELATLAAPEADPLAAIQMPLVSCRPTLESESLAQLIDRLGNRLGSANVHRLTSRASHVPERACRKTPAGAPPGPDQDAASLAGDQRPQQPRPLVLLPWPEPIAVVAPVPDGPPVMFRRKGRQHRVHTAKGPERIGPEWWREEGGLDPLQQSRIRDYYRIEDSDGGRFWIYREGLFRPDIPVRWFLHGLFP